MPRSIVRANNRERRTRMRAIIDVPIVLSAFRETEIGGYKWIQIANRTESRLSECYHAQKRVNDKGSAGDTREIDRSIDRSVVRSSAIRCDSRAFSRGVPLSAWLELAGRCRQAREITGSHTAKRATDRDALALRIFFFFFFSFEGNPLERRI